MVVRAVLAAVCLLAVSFVVLLAFPALPLPTGGLSHVLEVAAMLLYDQAGDQRVLTAIVPDAR